MAKASLTLPNGTVVEIEGTTDEVKRLLEFYGGAQPTQGAGKPTKPKQKRSSRIPKRAKGKDESQDLDLTDIVNLVKEVDEAESIEKQILDRTSQVDRALLPLYIVHEHLDNAHGLTSGDISKITTDLGIPISQPNASTTLSGTASRYVIGDKVKKKGQPVRYKLSRRGVRYLKDVLQGSTRDNKN